jgi:glycosyltransferase involved in cell wall biosynthesis
VRLSAPSLPGHGSATVPAERVAALAAALGSAVVGRVHVHHVMGVDFDLRRLIRALDVPFDFTVHDWFAICPQVNLLPHLDGQYCNEPDQAGCNACIIERPSHGAREILDWRAGKSWLLTEADRVLCPSEDVLARIRRYGAATAVLAPHEPAQNGPWRVRRPAVRAGEPLRIALIGVLADQKGLPTVRAFAQAADPGGFTVTLIGYPERKLEPELRRRLKATGPYDEAKLPRLLAKADPHVVWFPAPWPETWSYTLSAALAAELPVVATRIGAFPERLLDRPLTWLIDPDATREACIEVFEQARAALTGRAPKLAGLRPGLPGFYPDQYLAPFDRADCAESKLPMVVAGPPARRRVVVVPERFEANGMPTPCAYIRLLQPLSHPQAGAGFDLAVARPDEALDLRADILVTHRHAVLDPRVADRLAKASREAGTRLVYDLDDDLTNIPPDHADYKLLRRRAEAVQVLVGQAHTVWASTPALAAQLRTVRDDVAVVPNGLDERLWFPLGPRPISRVEGAVRVLLMGTATHDRDFGLVRPALKRLHDRFGPRLTVDMIGVSSRGDVPSWIHRMLPGGTAGYSYPGFVHWISHGPFWDIGLAPLADTAFNRSKSALKALDYAALGLAILASDVESYRGSLADGPGGYLVANEPDAWEQAIERMIRLDRTRREKAVAGREALIRSGLLVAQAAARQAALGAVLDAPIVPPPTESAAPSDNADDRSSSRPTRTRLHPGSPRNGRAPARPTAPARVAE